MEPNKREQLVLVPRLAPHISCSISMVILIILSHFLKQKNPFEKFFLHAGTPRIPLFKVPASSCARPYAAKPLHRPIR